MKKAEKILGVIAFLAIILRLINIPGSAFFLTISTGVLAMIYYTFGFSLLNNIRFREIMLKKSYEQTDAKSIVFSIISGINFSLITVGVLFKLMLWQGGNWELMVGLSVMVVLLGLVFLCHSKNKYEFYKNVIKRSVIIGSLGVVVLLIPTSTLIDLYYSKYPGYAEVFKRSLEDPRNMELRKELEEERVEMMLKKSENNL